MDVEYQEAVTAHNEQMALVALKGLNAIQALAGEAVGVLFVFRVLEPEILLVG